MSTSVPQVCTYSEFSFERAADAWQAFKNVGMGESIFRKERTDMALTESMEAMKPMGAGAGNGFSVWPDFKRYAFFGIWSDAESAERFFKQSGMMNWYRNQAQSFLHLLLQPIKAHGAWNGNEPLRPSITAPHEGPIAVLTRARIRWHKLPDFWRHVPAASEYMERAPGKLYSLGIGEYPLFMQATFSIWQSREDVMNAAYRHKAHAEVVKRTRERNWYSEEMFAQFAIKAMQQKGRAELARQLLLK